MRHPGSLGWVLVGLIAFAASCGEAGEDRTAGDSIAARLDSPVVVIGRDETEPGHLLHRIGNVIRFPDGRIAVAVRGENETRVFDDRGRLLTSMGGTGAGPKEFQALHRIWPVGSDSVAGLDVIGRRVSLWSLDGGFGRTGPMRSPGTVPAIYGRFEDGTLFGLTERTLRLRPAVGEVLTDSAVASRLDVEAGESRILTTFPGIQMAGVASPIAPGRVLVSPAPGSPRALCDTGPDYFVCGWGGRPYVVRFDTAGTPLDTLRIERPRRERTDEIVEAWLRLALERLQPEQRDQFRGYFRSFPQPDFLPWFDALVIDSQDRVWVREAPAFLDQPRAVWLVLTRDRPSTLVELPAAYEPNEIGPDWMIGVGRGPADQEMVVGYRVSRGER